MYSYAAHIQAKHFVLDKISMTGTFAICNLRYLAEQIKLVRICFSYKIFKIRIKNRHRWTTICKTLQDIKSNIHIINGQIILSSVLSLTVNHKVITSNHWEILFQVSKNYPNNCKKKPVFNLQSSTTTCSDQNLI